MKKSSLKTTAFVLTLIGALNWGLVGAFKGFNLVTKLFGSWEWLVRILGQD